MAKSEVFDCCLMRGKKVTVPIVVVVVAIFYIQFVPDVHRIARYLTADSKGVIR